MSDNWDEYKGTEERRLSFAIRHERLDFREEYSDTPAITGAIRQVLGKKAGEYIDRFSLRTPSDGTTMMITVEEARQMKDELVRIFENYDKQENS